MGELSSRNGNGDGGDGGGRHQTAPPRLLQGASELLLTTRLRPVLTAAPGFSDGGVHDLTLAVGFPELFALRAAGGGGTAGPDEEDVRVLAYLRAVRGGVRLSTVADRCDLPEEVAERRLNLLEAGGAVEERGGLFYMALPWRNVLAEAVTVEVVEEGDESAGAVEAALARAAGRSDTRADDPAGAPAHPRRFAHKAYVALPAPLAERVRAWESLLRQDGVGVLAFGGDSPPRVVADTPRRTPLSWPDYYRVALALSAGAQSAPAAAAKDPAAAG